MNFFFGHLPEAVEDPVVLLLLILLCFLEFAALYAILSKRIKLPPLIQIGLGIGVLGSYPVIDGLLVGYSGGYDAIIARWLILVIAAIVFLLHFVVTYYKKDKCKGAVMEMRTDWSELDAIKEKK